MSQKTGVSTSTIEKALTEYNIPDATMKALSIFKEAEELECKDADSRKIIGRHRADIKTLRPQVNTVRIALNKSFAEKNKTLADTIESALNKSFDIFDKKIKAYDSVAAEKKAKKDLEKKLADGLVQWHMDGLKCDCEQSLAFSLKAVEIGVILDSLKSIEISVVDFGESTEEAEEMLNTSIANTECAYTDRVDSEEEQEKQAKIAEENEAAADKLAKEQAEFKKEQEDAKAEQKKKDDAAALVVSQEAEKTRKANAKLEADRKELEKEKADLAAEKQADEDRKYSDEFNEAAAINYNMVHEYAINLDKMITDEAEAQRLEDILECHSEALEMDSIFDKDKKAKLKADKARAKLITSDKKKIQRTVNQVDKMISEIKPMEYGTDEGGQVVLDLYVRLKEALSAAEIAGTDLA